MAIQMRRGVFENFDPTKMLAGEWAIVLSGDPNTSSGRAIYHCFSTGHVERVATYVEAAQFVINLIPDIVDALTDAVQEAESDREDAESARQSAETDRQTAETNRQSAETTRESKVITSASGTVDSGTGTPGVDVTLGQPSSGGRNISFAFHNLVGPRGPQGIPGTVTPVTTSQIDDVVGDTSVTSDNALTATGLTYLWGKLKSKFAALVNGAVAITQGGTGATTAGDARKNLGTPASSSLATVEQSTATTSHAVGSHFVVDGDLRKATSAIVSGDSITSSNTTSDTLQGQIDTLRDSVGHTISGADSTVMVGRFIMNHSGRFDAPDQIIFVYDFSSNALRADICRNGTWKGSKVIATWS